MKKLFVIGQVWPEPTTTAAGNRMLQLLEAFLAKGYQITFASTSSKTKYSHDLLSMGIDETPILLNDSSFDVFVRQLNPNIVLFDRFMVEEQFGWRVAENCSKAVRILNTEDLHSLREHREKCVKNNLVFRHSEFLQQDRTKREVASIYRCDLTLLVSSFEKKLLENEIGVHKSLLWHLPFMLENIQEKTKNKWPKFEKRNGFIAFGNGRHAPNIDAFVELKRTIWPLVRKELPKAELNVYGAYLPQRIIEMHNPKKGFLVHGWIPDINEKVQRSKVVLAPLRFGAGIKGKLTKAMQNGTPSVTSKVGMEGMTKQQWPGKIADDPNEIAQYAIELYLDPEKWLQAQHKGISIINSEYPKEALSKSLFHHLESLYLGLKEHRNRNFIGSLLLYESMNATKYMGKWIEEKNKSRK